MKKYLGVVAVLGFLMCFVSGVSLAQEAEDTEDSWGTVSSLSSNQLVVSEYDYDSEVEVDVTYAVGPEVEVKNVDSLKNITVGDSVDIEYVIKYGKKVAKIISVEKSSEEE